MPQQQAKKLTNQTYLMNLVANHQQNGINVQVMNHEGRFIRARAQNNYPVAEMGQQSMILETMSPMATD